MKKAVVICALLGALLLVIPGCSGNTDTPAAGKTDKPAAGKTE